MKTTSGVAKRLVISLLLPFAVSGCAMYGSTPAYYDGGTAVYVAPPVYVAPRPFYADPWYAGPPVYFNFNYRSGGRYVHPPRRGWHGGHRGPGRHRR